MSILNIKIYGDKILRQKAEPVQEINRDILKLVDDMKSTMLSVKGVGLAAPQVGISKRIIIACDENGNKDGLVFINPEIIEQNGTIEEEEGCLSIPEIRANVKRAEKLIVRGLDIKGNCFKISSGKFFSRVIQHEIDHLNGILFVDHLNFVQKLILKKRLKNIKKCRLE